LGARERAHDEVEIRSGEARPTIRSDHRELIMHEQRRAWQAQIPKIQSRFVLGATVISRIMPGE
jgi:preprotein translocase subunit SecA